MCVGVVSVVHLLRLPEQYVHRVIYQSFSAPVSDLIDTEKQSRTLILLFAMVMCAWLPMIQSQQVGLFRIRAEGYFCYRIPAVILTDEGTLIAFAEARKFNCEDHGYVDMVLFTTVFTVCILDFLCAFRSTNAASTTG